LYSLQRALEPLISIFIYRRASSAEDCKEKIQKMNTASSSLLPTAVAFSAIKTGPNKLTIGD